ncbi:hypothetical protein AVCANL277_05605 [Campylobacter canadensis]|uniref:hypothetical protein n=1 Tax=Campylobacter canadensis TaxID=449520 RepID=UPI001556656E|nr:hypothetical protein [Campylobacter canadensis]MBZ8000333.1 hypothetical protein [Campylobacter canadensis]
MLNLKKDNTKKKRIFVIVSVLNLIFIIFVSYFAYYMDYINTQNIPVLIVLALILLINIFAFFAYFIKKRKMNLENEVLYDLLKTLNINTIQPTKIENYKALIEEIQKIKQKNISTHTHNQYLNNEFFKVIFTLKNIDKVLSFLNPNNTTEIASLIKQYNSSYIQTLAELCKYTHYYKTHYNDYAQDEGLQFDNAKVAILNNDSLENFILSNYLNQYNIKSFICSNATDFSTYDCVIVDESMLTNAKENYIILGNKNNDNYLKRPFDRLMLKNLLDNILKDKTIKANKENIKNDVLIFLDNDIQSSHLLHIVNKSASICAKVNSISAFLEEVKNNYKIIIVGYLSILYDFDNIKNVLNNIKLKEPNTFIIIFSPDSIKRNVDFADLIIKDATQPQLIEVIKKHL